MDGYDGRWQSFRLFIPWFCHYDRKGWPKLPADTDPKQQLQQGCAAAAAAAAPL